MKETKRRNWKFHYFSKHPTRNMMGLYWSVGLMDLGLAAVAIFEPIYLYTLGYSLQAIMFFYLLIYLVYILILPLFGRIISLLGLEHSIFYSQFFLIAFYISLFAISQYPIFFIITPFFLAIQKALYWPAYHADFTLFSSDDQRGREVGGLETLSTIVYIIGPLLGGFILYWTNFSTLFFVVAFLFLLSAFPLLKIKEIHSQEKFKYGEVFREIVDKQHRRNFFAYLGFGEELIVLTIWPIFIYTVISNYASIGEIVAGATFITGVVVLFLARLSDRMDKVKFLRWGSLIYFFSWVLRAFARQGGLILTMDTVSRFSKEMVFIPLQSMTYKAAKRLGPLAHGIFFEQSLSIAKLAAASAAILVIHYFDSPWLPLFFMAACFSLLYGIYKPRY